MEHLEDAVFNEGSKGVEEAIEFVESIVEMLSGSASKKVNVTVKWDGAPAVFAGINPENGKFFVGSKGVFNKTPKVNYTNADIKKNHKGGLVPKLQYALKHLKGLNIKGILQGDLMYTPGDIKSKTIDGESYITFTPNTITYAVPTDSDLAKEILASKIGIVFHTKYTGRNMSDMKASFNPNVKQLKKSRSVWFQDADFRDTSGSSTFTQKEAEAVKKQLDKVRSLLKQSSSFADRLKNQSNIIDMIKVYGNTKVREGKTKLSSDEFITFVNDKMQTAIDKLKTDAAKKRKEAVRDKLISDLTSQKTNISKVFDLHDALTRTKIMVVRKLEKIKSIGTFIKKEDGYEVTAPEGFVAVDRLQNKALKLVDRLEFSKANFSPDVIKGWQ